MFLFVIFLFSLFEYKQFQVIRTKKHYMSRHTYVNHILLHLKDIQGSVLCSVHRTSVGSNVTTETGININCAFILCNVRMHAE